MILKFNVTGMTCAACSARVERVTAGVNGVTKAEVNLLAGTMQVEAEDDTCCEAIIQAVVNAGYGASKKGDRAPKSEVKAENTELTQMQARIIGSAAFLLVLMYFTMGHMLQLPMPSWYMGRENALTAALVQFFLTLPAVYLNRSYFTRGL